MAVYLYENVVDAIKTVNILEQFNISKEQGMVFRCNTGYNKDKMRIINADGSLSFKDRFSINVTGYTYRYFQDWDHEIFFADLPAYRKAYLLEKIPTSDSPHIMHLEFIIKDVFETKS